MSMLGGYDPQAGRNAHEADTPTLIPVPSLLRSLLSDHLDPGYAAAAEAKAGGGEAPDVVAGVDVADLRRARRSPPCSPRRSPRPARRHPVCARRSRCWREASSPRKRPPTTSPPVATPLSAQVDAERRSRLEGDERGQQLLGSLDQANFAAAATPVIGPGLTITVTDPGMSKDLSDVSKERVAGSQQVILDRDLQLVVNSLWVSGAEAISVGGVRIGPNVTIRQAGGGILVDNQPISSPYVILAVGPPHAMQEVFDRSPGLQRLRLLETSYGVGVNVSAGDGLTLPAGSVRDINFAKQIGP